LGRFYSNLGGERAQLADGAAEDIHLLGIEEKYSEYEVDDMI
jgi:hypothetical protein